MRSFKTLCIFMLVTSAVYATDPATSQVSDASISALSKTLHAPNLVKTYYQSKGQQTAWTSSTATKFIETLSKAGEEGLNPDNYHFIKLSEIAKGNYENWPTNFEILLTDAFFSYASSLKFGLIDLRTNKPIWIKNSDTFDYPALLNTTLESGKFETTFVNLLPKDSVYQNLKLSIKHYQDLLAKGEWPQIAKGEKLILGMDDPRVTNLKARLAAEGYYELKSGDTSTLFDANVEEALKKFQEHHGLNQDGAVGPATLNALNLSIAATINQMEVSLDRIRATPALSPTKTIAVNIPAFELNLFEKDKVVLNMKVIAGRVDRKTPLFNDEVEYIVFNPAWYVPKNIAVKDKLPKIQKDPEFLKKMGMKLYENGEGGPVEVDPTTIDWSKVDSGTFNYKIVQRPGGGNALGTIKFIFPNKYDVYLHDTSDRHLFARDIRSFSSGCMRIEKYLEMANELLKGQDDWTPEKIKTALDSGVQRTITLKEKVPVHILYQTAWVDEKNELQLRVDIYRYDAAVKKYFAQN